MRVLKRRKRWRLGSEKGWKNGTVASSKVAFPYDPYGF